MTAMISQSELDQAIARWKARKTGMAMPDDARTPMPVVMAAPNVAAEGGVPDRAVYTDSSSDVIHVGDEDVT